MECDGGQTFATIERPFSNARHAVANGDGGQTTATLERITANARHAVANGDGGQTTATIERIFANARHTVGNLDGGQTTATRVCVIYWISSYNILNGRKVMTYVRLESKKVRI